MVFTSDRAGGYGGFDLWYSSWDGQQWSAPVNFGGKINTEYDEYRPIVVSTDEKFFLNDLMIFSSDRPGGKGALIFTTREYHVSTDAPGRLVRGIFYLY